MMKIKRVISAALVTGVLIAGAAAVSAQPGPEPVDPSTQTQPWRGHFGQPGLPGAGRGAGERIREMIRGRAGGGVGYGLPALIRAAADATGLDVSEIAQQLRNDVSLASLVESAGGDVNAIIQTVLAQAQTQLAQAVENGRITQELSDQWIAELETHLNTLMTQSPLSRRVEALAPVSILRFAASELGITPAELRAQLASGTSLGSALTAGGIDPEAFVSDVMARAAARLNVLVVDERITQERADQQLAELEAHLRERLNAVNPVGV